MKKIILYMIFISLHFYMFANEKTHLQNDILFKIPEMKFDFTKKDKQDPEYIQFKKSSSSLTMIAMGSLLLTFGTPFLGGAIGLGTMGVSSLTLMVISIFGFLSDLLLLGGATLISVGAYRYKTLKKTQYKSEQWNMFMNNLEKILGIMMLSSSVLSAGATGVCIGYVAYDPMLFTALAFPLFSSIIVFLSHIIPGCCMLGLWAYHKQEYELNIYPDLAITHDEKKSYNEGYGVSLGMRVRI